MKALAKHIISFAFIKMALLELKQGGAQQELQNWLYLVLFALRKSQIYLAMSKTAASLPQER